MSRPQEEKRIVVTDSCGIELRRVRNGTVLWHLNWSDVSEIAAWKEELFTYDSICFGFSDGGGGYLWCWEEDAGWQEMVATVEERFSIREEWFRKVAVPAFKPNLHRPVEPVDIRHDLTRFFIYFCGLRGCKPPHERLVF